jgi:hypothetical protein
MYIHTYIYIYTYIYPTVRQFRLENPNSPDLPRIVSKSFEFKEFGSIKKIDDDTVTHHYIKFIETHKLELLSSYQEYLSLESLETRFVIAKQTRQTRYDSKNSNYSNNTKMNNRTKKLINSSYGNGTKSVNREEVIIPLGGMGFNFYRVINSKLIKYTDLCSFLSAYINHIEIDAPVNIETVDINELHSLFKIDTHSTPSLNNSIKNIIINDILYESQTLPFNKIISGRNKALHLVDSQIFGCNKNNFPDYNTFEAMNLTISNVTFLPLNFVDALPMGKMLPKLD